MTKPVLAWTLAGVIFISLAPYARADGSVRSIVVNNLTFGQAPQGLRVGDVVEWTNADIFRHSATASDSSFDIDLPPGAKGRAVLKRAGMVNYFCRFHPGMKGKLMIEPLAACCPPNQPSRRRPFP
jgi:plastocyanin